MEEGEIIDDRRSIPQPQAAVVGYRAPVNYARRLGPHSRVHSSLHHSPLASQAAIPPMIPLNLPIGSPRRNIHSNLLRSNVIGRKLSQNEIRLMALQNMKSNNSIIPQSRLTKRQSHVNSFQLTKRPATAHPPIQAAVHSNNIRPDITALPPNQFNNTRMYRQRLAHGQKRSRPSDGISQPMNQNNILYNDNFQTAAQAAQVRLSGVKPAIRNEELAMYFGRFGRIVDIQNDVGNVNRIIQFASRLEAQRCLSAGSQQRICDSRISVVPFSNQYNTSLKSSRDSILVNERVINSPPKVDHGKGSKALPKNIENASAGSSSKIENRDPRLEKDEDDLDEDNAGHLQRCKKQKLTKSRVDQTTSNLNKNKNEFLVTPGSHIDDCYRDAMSLSSRYTGLAIPEEFVEMQANWVHTFPVDISKMIPNNGLCDQISKSRNGNLKSDDNGDSSTTMNEIRNETFLKSDLLKTYPFVVCEWLHQHDITPKKKKKNRKISIRKMGQRPCSN